MRLVIYFVANRALDYREENVVTPRDWSRKKRQLRVNVLSTLLKIIAVYGLVTLVDPRLIRGELNIYVESKTRKRKRLEANLSGHLRQDPIIP